MIHIELIPALGVHHRQKHRDGARPAGGGILPDEIHFPDIAERIQEFLQAALFDGVRQIEIGGLRVFIGRIMREVRADDKEVFFIEVRL